MALLAPTRTLQAARFQATQTEEANKAAAILEQIKQASREAEDLAIRNARLVYGPANASLTHHVDNTITTFDPNLRLKNFVASITFVNPYDTATTGRWDYGILFRNNYSNDQYRLTILSNQSWTLVDASTWTDIFSRNDKHILPEAGEENTIWLVVIDTKAYLFINRTYIQSLEVGAKLSAGDISPAIGLYYGNETASKITKFRDFVVWSLP